MGLTVRSLALAGVIVVTGVSVAGDVLASRGKKGPPPAATEPPAPTAAPESAPPAPPPSSTPAPAPAPAATPQGPAPAAVPPPAPAAAGPAVVPVTVADDTLETVALLPLNAPDPGMSQGATAQAAQGLRDLRVFKVVDPETIAGLLGAEALRQSTGCSDASCLAELAGAVGASYVVSGTISQSGEDYTINLVLTDQRSARALDGVVRQEKSAKDIGPGVRLAAQRVVQKLLANKLGTLRVISQEKGADVKIDDVLVGTTPLAPLQFPMGPHKVSVEKTGFIANRQEVVVRPNEVVPVNAELIPSQEFINGYRAKNRVLRILAWLGAGLTGVALTSGVAAYAGWMGLYLGFNQQSPEDALVALVTPPNPRNGFPGDLVVQSTSLKKDYQWMWLPMDLLAAWMLVAPALALGAAVFGGVFWLIGDDPGRYNRYSE